MTMPRRQRIQDHRASPVGWVYVLAADVLAIPKVGVSRATPKQTMLNILGEWLDRGVVVQRCNMWAVRSTDRHRHCSEVRMAVVRGERDLPGVLREVCGTDPEKVTL